MNTIGSYFKQLSILHGAMCAGVAIVIGVMRYIGREIVPAEDSQIYPIIGGVLAFLNLVLARVLLFKTVAPAQQNPSLSQKLALFRQGFIIQMALLEGAAIINMILWFLAGNTFNLGIALALLFVMIYRRPARTFVRDMIFNPNEDGRIIFNDDVEF